MAKTKFGDKDVKSIKMLEMEEIRVTADLVIWVLLILIPLIWLMMVMTVMDRDHRLKHYIDKKDCGTSTLTYAICSVRQIKSAIWTNAGNSTFWWQFKGGRMKISMQCVFVRDDKQGQS